MDSFLESRVLEAAANTPVRWTGRKIPLKNAVRRFAFMSSVQLKDADDLTNDYLLQMAKVLEDSKSLMLVATGEKGSGLMIFQSNERSYRGFSEGKTQITGYSLTLHLSDMELKRLVAKAGRVAHGECIHL